MTEQTHHLLTLSADPVTCDAQKIFLLKSFLSFGAVAYVRRSIQQFRQHAI
jgi:hypothetical protein